MTSFLKPQQHFLLSHFQKSDKTPAVAGSPFFKLKNILTLLLGPHAVRNS